MLKKISYCLLLGLLIAADSVYGAWDFRGEPNDWAQTRMTQVSDHEWVITQAFAADEDEFKIARDDGWVVSFPVENVVVAPGGTYFIQFFDDINQIFVSDANALTWNFRGTSNAWSETAMVDIGNGEFETCQQFANGDANGGPRFKIARDDWNISFPSEDRIVAPNSAHRIIFSENSNAITTIQVASCDTTPVATWNFRGTPNSWGETPLTDLGNGTFETCQSFVNGDTNGGPRFKIARDDWDTSFPADDFGVASNQDVHILFDENTNTITTTNVAFCNAPDGLTVVGQKARFTLRDVAFRLTPDMLNVSGASAFTMNVFGGANYTVAGSTVTPDAGFVGDLNITVNVEAEGETSGDFAFVLPVMDLNRDRSMIVHTPSILSSGAADLSLVRFFDHLAAQSNEPGLTGVQLFRQFWDTQNPATAISVGPNCGDETLADGFTAALNGFPIGCDRAEGQQVQTNDAGVLLEMQSYFPIAVINRFDLHSEDFSDCGEHRMIFARSTSNGPGRNFIITEARIPNPQPGSAQACQPLVNFWLSLNAQSSDADIARAIEQAYYTGFENFPAIMSIEHFAEGAGQIRTNQFITFQWMLREYKLSHACSGTNCTLRALPVTVKENPFGRLFNGNEPSSGSEFATRAADFQADFISNIATLTNNNVAALKIVTGDTFNNGRSHASGLTNENDFDRHFLDGTGSAFFNDLNTAVAGSLDANGNPLTATQILNRATALTCGGCHQPSTFGLTQTNAIGAMQLPTGEIITSWPSSAGFVHVREFVSGGEFPLSTAMNSLFLPIREHVLAEYLTTLAQ